MRSRGNSWQIDIHLSKERHFATFPKTEYSYEDVLQIEKDIRARLGKQKVHVKDDINSVASDYLDWVKLHQKPATLRLKRYLLTLHILPFFGAMTPERITEGLITTYKKKRKQEIKSAVSKGNDRMINLELLTLRHLCSQMFKEKISAELLPHRKELPVVLTKEEVKAFLDAAEPKYRTLFVFMYHTGSRLSEALNTKWSDLDGNNVTIYGKGGRWRNVPISNTLKVELALYKGIMVQHESGRLFPFSNIYKAVDRTRKKAGIEKRVYPHLLRHTLGTHILEATGDIRTIQEIFGHQAITTTEIYTHIADQQKRNVLEKTLG